MKVLLLLVPLIAVALAEDVVPEKKNGCNYQYIFNSAGQQAQLTSPNWPNSYPNNANCRYNIQAPAGTQIKMDCEINVEHASKCAYDKLTVSLSGDTTLSDGRSYCGKGSLSQTSQSNALMIRFTSDYSNPSSSTPYRYSCTLSTIGNAQPTESSAAAGGSGSSSGSGSGQGSFSNNTCTCGARNDGSRIVGGVNAGVNEFPWRVGLYRRDMGAFCGGTLISPNWVLTAAHCTEGLDNRYPLMVNLGDHDLRTTSETNNQVIEVDRIVDHPLYNNQTTDNDMSLLHLKRTAVYSQIIQPICLPWTMAAETFQGKTVTASGWGTTSSGGSASPVLKKVDLPVLTTEECRRYYGRMVTNNMFCTYSVGKDTCQGDSGGSIDYQEPNSGRYFGIGVVSWGIGCAGENQPGVYAKVTNYLQWIQQNTNGEQFCR